MKWLVLYSKKQDAYHVETEADYKRKGNGSGDYRIVGTYSSEDAALQAASKMRQGRYN